MQSSLSVFAFALMVVGIAGCYYSHGLFVASPMVIALQLLGVLLMLWARVTLRNAEPQARAGMLADADFFPDRVEAWLQRTEPAGWAHLVSGEGAAAAEKATPAT